MKIAYFTDTYTPEINGVTNTLEKLSAYLEHKRIRHAFFAPGYDGSGIKDTRVFPTMKEVYRFTGIKVAIAPNSCLTFPNAKRLFDICDEFAPDVVHVTTEFGIGYKGMKYAISRGLPLIMSYHTDYCKYLDYHNLGFLESFIEVYLKKFYSYSQRTLVPSQHTLNKLREKGYDNLGIWSRGIDTEKFNASWRSEETRNRLGIAGRFAFLYVGRLSPEKGLRMFLCVIERINRLFPHKAVFIFTGDGPFTQEIRQAGFDNVILTGFKRGRELSEIYASCDCFAFPSGTETFGNTCLEALASGLPVAAVNSGGVTDYLTHGENALLCADGDNEAFAEQLVKIMHDEQLRRALSHRGGETASSRDWNRIFDGLIGEYEAAARRTITAERKYAS